jgi:hypothetical protein
MAQGRRVVETAMALALLAAPALAQSQPKPVEKVVGPCPSGYQYSAGSCAPLNQRSRKAVVKKAPCPSGWSQSGAYCIRQSP